MKSPIAITRANRWWDWPAALLLIAAILVAAIRLNATNWTRELDLVQTVAFLGVIAGLALGQSSFSPATVRFFAFAYGAFTIIWQVGLTIGQGMLWPERLESMWFRLLIILDQIYRQKPVSNNLFFHLLMATLFWSLSCYAGYSLARYGNAWRAIVPAGLAIVIIHAYDAFFPVRMWFLVGYIFLSLILISRLNFVHLRNRWKENGTYLPPFIGLDSIRLGIAVTVILVLLSWSVPALASSLPPAEQVWRRATQPWMDIRTKLSNVFYSLQASVGVITDFYGDTMPLGRGNPLTDTVIMTIEAPPRPAASVRYYWRSRVYDYYDGDWSNTFPAKHTLTPDDFNLAFPEFNERTTSRFTIKTYFPIQNLHTPSQPVWISRPVDAFLASNPDGTIDLSHLKATPLLNAGETYQVDASLTTATQSELRAAANLEYPEWVLDRYLQLPDTITDRTRQLADQITAGLNNPYDKAQAITNYLRGSLRYSETVPPPPDGREPIDWILFEHRQAFCNYYATAEIILLRTLGIPARLAVGYAEGERRVIGGVAEVPTLEPGGVNIPAESAPLGDLFTVRHRDAHAWPEVFFPGIGWVEFEPTVSQQPIIRPFGELENSGSSLNNPANSPSLAERLARERADLLAGERDPDIASGEQAGVQIPAILIIFAILTTFMILVLTIRRVRIRRGVPPLPVQLEDGFHRIGVKPPSLLQRWANLARLSPLERAYLELNRALSRLGRKPAITDTPLERGAVLTEILPTAQESIEHIVHAYQAAIYGNLSIDGNTAHQDGLTIKKQSYQALWREWLNRLRFSKRTNGLFTSPSNTH